MNLIDGLKAAFSFLSSVSIVVSVCFLGRFEDFLRKVFSCSRLLFSFRIFFPSPGWFLVYKLFLLRFKVVRELLGQLNEPADKSEESKPKSRKIRRD